MPQMKAKVDKCAYIVVARATSKLGKGYRIKGRETVKAKPTPPAVIIWKPVYTVALDARSVSQVTYGCKSPNSRLD